LALVIKTLFVSSDVRKSISPCLQGFCDLLNYKRGVAENLNILTVSSVQDPASFLHKRPRCRPLIQPLAPATWPWADFFPIVSKTSACLLWHILFTIRLAALN
jgi:hypothetical protein